MARRIARGGAWAWNKVFWSAQRNPFNVPYSNHPSLIQTMRHMPKGLTRAVGALLALVALYSLLGFLILPGIALRIANQQLAQYQYQTKI